MARYGRDFDRNRGGMFGGRGGMGRDYGRDYGYGFGGAGNEDFRGGMSRGGGYGGMGSDAFEGREDFGGRYRGGLSGFGTGGGAYDVEYGGGLGYGGFGGRRSGFGREMGRDIGGGYRGEFGEEGGFGFGSRRGMRGGYGAYQGGYGGGYGESGYGEGGYGGGMGRGHGPLREIIRRRVSEIMTRDPETVTSDATLADAAKKMRDLDVGIIPVIESGDSRRLRGVVTDRDIAIRAIAEGKDLGSTRVSDVMTTDVETCNQNDSVDDILNLMERVQVRRVPITDREGRLVGIVAQADVALELTESPEGMHEIADTLERISEPGQGRLGLRGSQSRGLHAGGRTGGALQGRTTSSGRSTGTQSGTSQSSGTQGRGQSSSSRGSQQRGSQDNP